MSQRSPKDFQEKLLDHLFRGLGSKAHGFQVRTIVHKMPDPDIKQALVKPDANFADARPRMSRMARKSWTKQTEVHIMLRQIAENSVMAEYFVTEARVISFFFLSSSFCRDNGSQTADGEKMARRFFFFFSFFFFVCFFIFLFISLFFLFFVFFFFRLFFSFFSFSSSRLFHLFPCFLSFVHFSFCL